MSKVDSVEDALRAAIGSSDDGSGLPVPPLLSVIAAYLKPFEWKMNRVQISPEPQRERSGVLDGSDWIGFGRDITHWRRLVVQVSTGVIEWIQRPVGVHRTQPNPLHPESSFALDLTSLYHLNERTGATTLITEHGLDEAIHSDMICTSDGKTLWLAHGRFGCLRRLDIASKSMLDVEGNEVDEHQFAWNRGPNIKPDSELLIVTETEQLLRYDITTNQMSTVIESGVETAECTETGFIIISGADYTLKVFDPLTGELTPIPFVFDTVVWVMVCHDKRWLLGATDAEAWRMDLPPDFFLVRPCCNRDL